MKKALKWLLMAIAAAIVVAVAALVIVPRFVDLNRFKPQLEKQASELAGRPVTLGGDIDLSLFPWAGVSLADLRLGNPPGFAERDLLSVKAFEVRVKLLPLLSKKIEVKRFVIDSPRLVLTRNRQGAANWEGLGQTAAAQPKPAPAAKDSPAAVSGELPIRSLAVEAFAVRNGSLLWLDEKSGARHEVSELMMELKDLSLERPVSIEFSALADGRPLAVRGTIGPVGKKPGATPLPIEMAVTAVKEISLQLKGTLSDLTAQPKFDAAIQLAPFSPRRAMQTLGLEAPQTGDPNVLSKLSLSVKVSATSAAAKLSEGLLTLDDSQAKFSLQAKEFDKPNVAFRIDLDRIDADRYLPPAAEKASGSKTGTAAATQPTDYAPLRKPVIDGALRIGDLKINGARLQDLDLKLTARNGRYHLDPITLNLYDGTAAASALLDVSGAAPQTSARIQARKIQAGPLLTDVLQQDALEGTLQADVALAMRGDEPGRIKQSLNGQGNLLFSDGAIKGIDLASMARNVKAAFSQGKTAAGPKPRTDFSELKAPFTLVNGRFNTQDAQLVSPLLRLKAQGSADLVSERLDFRLEPTLVGTIKGQGDAKERAGIMVPILVSGTFDEPAFRPDLEEELKKRAQQALTDPEKFKETLKQDKKSLKSLEKRGKELFKELKRKQ
ncbi:MAG: AsmA family protein [Deltaproteobacteria bacterium]|nr:AsmA family protein [Deltaproteobacteria bacterium]